VRVSFEELGVHRVWARVEPRNEPSVRLCERLGMRREGVLEQASWFKGEWTDLAFYALLADEWRAGRTP
jgi:aminoglycoside 6'-N-acetyltransferase